MTELVKLATVTETIMGQAPSSHECNKDGTGTPFVKAGEFGLSRPLIKEWTTNPLKFAKYDDVLLCVVGATCGKINKGFDGAIGRSVAAVRAKPEFIDKDYLYYFLQTWSLRLRAMSQGAAQTVITRDMIGNLEIYLPPLSEQRRIASILDQADELRQKRQQAIEKLDQLFQATFIDMFGDPVSNPKGWDVKKLSEQVDLIQIGPFGTQLHQEDYIENGIPLINPSHIKNGKIVPNHKLTVSQSKYEELTQYHLSLNDVLLGRRGEMGRCAVVTQNEVGWLCGTGSLFLRPNLEKINPFFLELLLSSDSIKRYLENVSQGQTMANLNKTIVGSIPLISPSIEIQNKFFLIAEKIDKMKTELKSAKNQVNNLFESLQNQAFNGTSFENLRYKDSYEI